MMELSFSELESSKKTTVSFVLRAAKAVKVETLARKQEIKLIVDDFIPLLERKAS